MKQIFGYTAPESPPTGYVGFAMAFSEENGDVSLQVRQHGGEATPRFIVLPIEQAEELARAIYRIRKKEREGKSSDAPQD